MSFSRELECAGKTLHVKQLYVGDVGCVVWDAALVLSKFLENVKYFPPLPACFDNTKSSSQEEAGKCIEVPFWKGKKVVDLGSGTGVVGLVAAVLGANVVLTDLPDFVELMKTNIEINSDVLSGEVKAEALTWGTDLLDDVIMPKPDAILLSDVIYYEESLVALMKTVVELCHEFTTIILSYEERSTGNKAEIEKKFFQMMEKRFKRTDIPFESLDDTFRSTDIHVILFHPIR